MKMTKNDFCAAVVAELKKNEEISQKIVTKKLVGIMLDAIASAVYTVLNDGNEVVLPGLAKFGTKVQPGRTGIISFGENAGQEWQSEDKTVPTIKAVKPLKDAVL